ncbi:MAG: hypothetical protein ACXW27_02270 [Allosphingosinicella sp.]
MTGKSEMSMAERFIVRRALWARILAVFPLTWIIIRLPNAEEAPNLVIAGVWAVVVVTIPILFLASGGVWPRDKGLRALVNDESTVAHRSSALAAGACFALGMAAAFWLLSWVRPVDVHQALATVIDACLGATLIRFASLESAALKDDSGFAGEEVGDNG